MIKSEKTKGKVLSLLKFIKLIDEKSLFKVYESKNADFIISLHRVLSIISNKTHIHLYDEFDSIKTLTVNSVKKMEFKCRKVKIKEKDILFIKDICSKDEEVDVKTIKNGEYIDIIFLVSKRKPIKIVHDKIYIKK